MGARACSLWLYAALILLGMAGEFWAAEEVQSEGSEFCRNHVLSKDYDCEEHKIYSEDGYMLVMHRVWAKPKTISKGIHLELPGFTVMSPVVAGSTTSFQGSPENAAQPSLTGSVAGIAPSSPSPSPSSVTSVQSRGSGVIGIVGVAPTASLLTPPSFETPTSSFSSPSSISAQSPTLGRFAEGPSVASGPTTTAQTPEISGSFGDSSPSSTFRPISAHSPSFDAGAPSSLLLDPPSAQSPGSKGYAIGFSPTAALLTPQSALGELPISEQSPTSARVGEALSPMSGPTTSAQTPTLGRFVGSSPSFLSGPISAPTPTNSIFGKLAPSSPVSRPSAKNPESEGVVPTPSLLIQPPAEGGLQISEQLTPSNLGQKPTSSALDTSTFSQSPTPASSGGTQISGQKPPSSSFRGAPFSTSLTPTYIESPGSDATTIGMSPWGSLSTPQSVRGSPPSPASTRGPSSSGLQEPAEPIFAESPGSESIGVKPTESLSTSGSAPSGSLKASTPSSRTSYDPQTPNSLGRPTASISDGPSARNSGSGSFGISPPSSLMSQSPEVFRDSPPTSARTPTSMELGDPSVSSLGGSPARSELTAPNFGCSGPSGRTSSQKPSAEDDALASAALAALEGNLDDLRRKLRREAVLLMHHELLNGDSWFNHVELEGGDALLPLSLVDQGFEVWIGHERATLWSHDHLNLETRSQAYWNWTWEQHAELDVPAMLNYVTDQTRNKVHYVGVSQSATVGVAAATRPEVANLMQSLTLIGPSIYRGSTTPLSTHTWAEFFSQVTTKAAANRHSDSGSFNFPREFYVTSLSLGKPSTKFRSTLSGPDCCLGSTYLSFENGWDGITSYKNVRHFEQGIVKNSFQRFDYGSGIRNAEAYNGRKTPPVYEPKDIPANLPILVVYGGQDFYSPPDGILDFLAMTKRRPQTVYLPQYAHLDLFFSRRREDDVYEPIQDFLRSQLPKF